MMVPTMLEVNFEKTSKVKNRRRKETRQSLRIRAGQASATRQTVKTDGLSGSSFAALMSVNGAPAPLVPDHVLIEMINRPMLSSHLGGVNSPHANQPSKVQNEIINDIN